MNHYSGYAHAVPSGWWAMVRFARDGRPKPILGDSGAPVVYPTELEAVKAVNASLLRYFNGDYLVRAGDRCSAAKSAANRLFKKGGGTIEVERKGVRA
ncbi:hypothetical protein [Pararhizobium sp.]|uniref:hypothetical protein n=1 Tax=Pararhizobium sp. TaxID=1977563 RepID=UPI00272139AC|nr:hypothetical protein [Pararhizobium sp.]MDO9417011.1 hypothetical protein [Pararhizobium sp.]